MCSFKYKIIIILKKILKGIFMLSARHFKYFLVFDFQFFHILNFIGTEGEPPRSTHSPTHHDKPIITNRLCGNIVMYSTAAPRLRPTTRTASTYARTQTRVTLIYSIFAYLAQELGELH